MKNNLIDDPSKSALLKRWLGLALIVLSFIFYGGLLLVPFIPFSAVNNFLGKEAVSKYRNIDWSAWVAGLFGIFGKNSSTAKEKEETKEG
jgi:hypothetical protein